MKKTTQTDRIKQLFLSRQGEWISLIEILSLFISQYNARIYDLRHSGFDIRNKVEFKGGQKHSWYMLVG